jgi:putative aldouronate transport system substrate-binding protein
MFGAYVGNVHDNQYFWLPDETGRLRPGIAFPEFMVALEYWQRWFEEGLLSADFMTMDDTRAHENVVNGLVGIQPWWQWWGWMNGPTIIGIQGSNDAHFIPFNLPTVEGDRPARGQVFFPGGDIIVAHRDFQNPAALMKVISMVDSLMFDPSAVLTEDDIRYLMTDGREQSMGPVFNILDPQADMIMMQYVQRAIELNDPSILAGPRHLSAFADSYNWLNYRYPISALGRFLQLGFPGSAYSRAQHLFDNDWIVRDGRWGAVPEEFALAGPTGDIILQEAMQIIMGIQPVSHWHTVMEQWYAQGGQIKEDAVNLHFGN